MPYRVLLKSDRTTVLGVDYFGGGIIRKLPGEAKGNNPFFESSQSCFVRAVKPEAIPSKALNPMPHTSGHTTHAAGHKTGDGLSVSYSLCRCDFVAGNLLLGNFNLFIHSYYLYLNYILFDFI